MRAEDRDATARAICRERCAFMGEPPCWEVGAWPNEEYDEPGCAALGDAALAAVAPMIAAAERERVIAATRAALNAYGRWDAAITPDTLMAKIEPAIRALGDAT